jgi:hypothetical protein
VRSRIDLTSRVRLALVQVYDNPVLGMWAWKMRKDQRNNKLAQWKVDKLDSLEFLWKVDQVTSKWHTNLHDCRRYKVGICIVKCAPCEADRCQQRWHDTRKLSPKCRN